MATTTLEPSAGAYRRSWVLDWLTTVDHKKIGILYIVNSFLFFFAAGILALVIRSELAVPGMQFLDQDTYNQAFTMHGTIMLFLFVIPALSGFGNYIVPLQLGADGERQDPGREKEHKAVDDVQDPDLLVVDGRQPVDHPRAAGGGGSRRQGGGCHRFLARYSTVRVPVMSATGW